MARCLTAKCLTRWVRCAALRTFWFPALLLRLLRLLLLYQGAIAAAAAAWVARRVG